MATSSPFSGFTPLGGAPASNDLLGLTDVSDSTQSANGTTKRMTVANLFTSPTLSNPSLTGTTTVATLTATGTLTGTNAVFAAGSVTVTINATSGDPSLVFQKASTQTAAWVSDAASTMKLNDNGGVTIATFGPGGTLNTLSSLTVNTNKFTVNGTSGDTAVAGALGVTGIATVAQLNISSAASRIIPGATSLSLRNTANSADNFIITDAGVATIRAGLTVTAGGLAVSAGAVTAPSLAVTGGLTSSGPTGTGIGYATGAGGAVTQTGSRATAVTLNKLAGAITTDTTSLSSTFATFTVNNSTVAATDTVHVALASGSSAGAGATQVYVSAVAAGSFKITVNAVGVTETGALVINFAVIKSVAS